MNGSLMRQQWGTRTTHHGFKWFDTYEDASEARSRLARYRKRNRIKLAPEEIETRWTTTARREFGIRFCYAGSSADKESNEGWEWFRSQTLRDEKAETLEEQGCQVDLYTRFVTEPEKQ